MEKISRRKFMKVTGSVLLLTTAAPLAAYATSDTAYSGNAMKDILLASTDDYYIVVSVPESQAISYEQKLATNAKFRNQEIQSALGQMTVGTYALPEGNIEYQSYLRKSNIKAVVDNASGTGTFDNWYKGLGWAVSLADITGLIKLTKKANIFILSADILITAVEYAKQEREAWWNQAYVDIINGSISAVRYTIVQNMKSEYPKVWRVFERV